jgi:hypothetical protein
MIMAEKSEQEIDHTIVRNIPRLAKYGVLTVRPGYEVTGHQFTGRRAIVATVHTKKPLAELRQPRNCPTGSTACRLTCAKRGPTSGCARPIRSRPRLASAEPTPSWFGDSVGHYEGDTLVIDTVGITGPALVDRIRSRASV